MAEMTIRLRVNPETGKKDIVVALHSDDDSLPHEHEHLHRQLVEKLIHGGLVGADEAGALVIERLEDPNEAAPATTKRNAEDQPQGISEV